MQAEHFSLSWNNYHVNLSSGFHELLQSEHLVDVTLAVEGKCIKAHKTILSICSPYFQELFKVNPCKHPIVIMHGMNYSILYHILQFMYKGEVSVRQEDIPQFLKIAETLKVKGLTERDNDIAQSSNSNTSSNGVNSTESPMNNTERQTQVMKRSKPVKSKPYSKPEPPPLPVPLVPTPPAVETEPVLTEPSPIEEPVAVETAIVPKEEPVEIHEETDDYHSTIDEHSNMDVTHMLDAQLGEPSHTKNEDSQLKSQQDITASGGPLLFLKSRRGHPVLIHSGHMYTLTTPQQHPSLSPPPPLTSMPQQQLTAAAASGAHALRRVTWFCVKQRTLGCGGCLVTTATSAHASGSPVPPTLLSYSGHNHAQLHDVIQRLQAQSCSPSPELMPPP